MTSADVEPESNVDRDRPRMTANSRLPGPAAARVAADIGGTFTDVVAFDERTGGLRLGKSLSTPDALVKGIGGAVEKSGVSLADASLFVHGTTVVVNTLLERTGARTALVLTEGFRDIYEMGRGNRPDAYNLFFRKHVPLVERALCYCVRERMLANGTVHVPLDEAGVRAICDVLEAQGIEAVGILLLHSYANPAHEKRVKEIVQDRLPRVFVTASHELSQEYREFERCSTVAANAYVGPKVQSYLAGVQRHLKEGGFHGPFLVVQSSGGLTDVDHARRHCVRMLESGPAGGIIGVGALCEALGLRDAIGIDMGGTTAKAGVLYQGEVLTTSKAMVGGYAGGLPIQAAMIDIFEVGTGGGSIARAGEERSLRVGPQSAGADPGPACYGRGGVEPTVTDANLVLGRLAPGRFLGGEMKLDPGAAATSIRKYLAERLQMPVHAAAAGVLRIATAAMAGAVRTIATSRGLDAGAFDLVAYGGAGPLHAAAVMHELGMRSLIIPRAPGHFSAFGMLFSNLRVDFVRTRLAQLGSVSFDELEAVFREEESKGTEALTRAPIKLFGIVVQRALEMRYVGQEHAVVVDLPISLFQNEDRAGIKQRFDNQHALRYGTSVASQPAEIVNLRGAVTGVLRTPPLERIRTAGSLPVGSARSGERPIFFPEVDSFVGTAAYARERLLAGHRLWGPAVVEEDASTTVIPPGDELLVDEFGNLVIFNAARRV